MTRRRVRRWIWPVVQIVVAGAVLATLVVRLGGEPIRQAWDSLTWWALVGAVLAAGASTALAAYRWRYITRALGVPITYPRAFRAYYSSQLLNSTLPGGVLGDVNRAIRHGHAAGAPARSIRSVVWDRVLGQTVQSTVTVLVLLVIASPMRPPWFVSLAIAAATAVIVAAAVRAWRHRRRTARHSRAVTTVIRDVAALVAVPGLGSRVALSSLGVVAGYVVIFVISALSVDPRLTATTVLWMAMVVLLIGAVPLNIAGWGPREGAAVWVFTLAGLGADMGLAVSIVYGLLALAGTLPGMVTLIGFPRAARRG